MARSKDPNAMAIAFPLMEFETAMLDGGKCLLKVHFIRNQAQFKRVLEAMIFDISAEFALEMAKALTEMATMAMAPTGKKPN